MPGRLPWRAVPAALPLLFLAAVLGRAGAETPLPLFSDRLAWAIDAPALDQHRAGFFGGGSLSGLYAGEQPGRLLMVTPPGNALLGRWVNRPLAGLPRLNWSWRRFDPGDGQPETLADDSPMRIIIGFAGGAGTASPSPAGAAALPFHTAFLPPFDRAVVVVWSNARWESGAADRQGMVARFIAHGGPADGAWWQESLDLAGLHARLWPDISGPDLRIAWVAVGVRPSDGRTAGEVAGLALSP